jgi:hypothetical protein
MAWPLYFMYAWRDYRIYRSLAEKTKPVTIEWLSHQTVAFTWCWFLVYAIARLGNLILMFTSLRALPAASYVSIDWLSTIPHI